jgi:hypothetical protein
MWDVILRSPPRRANEGPVNGTGYDTVGRFGQEQSFAKRPRSFARPKLQITNYQLQID